MREALLISVMEKYFVENREITWFAGVLPKWLSLIIYKLYRDFSMGWEDSQDNCLIK